MGSRGSKKKMIIIEKNPAGMQYEVNRGEMGILARRVVEFRRNYEATRSAQRMIDASDALQNKLQEMFNKGREEGFRDAAEPIIKSCYAGICIALHDEFGFGEEMCFQAIKAVHDKVMWSLGHTELVDEVLEKTGLELNLDEPLEAVRRRDKGGGGM